ncbi:chromosome segregation protein SMC [Halobacteriales archaeon SW_5_70_135]|nr:MAG: chromosome segregation protein SMC [Halobacteriales archaeon SW_5_70_135]
MHIKELVLEEFKSFKGTTRIPLYDDFTTISGPNGSGKSNIIDGVLFALGLARTRGIRARKLTDLIHNPGHDPDPDAEDGRRRGGPSEAAVTVVLDNTDRAVERADVAAAMGVEERAVDTADEITVRRRVKETEENYYSYYYLNDRSVNLSDVRELLSAAGVTPEGYNVVMQGDVTDITSMTARERRQIVDEIAGVAQFDEKKADALDELETVQERIEEADLRIEERETRLERLADERETALNYRELQEEKEEYESYRKAAELEDKREELAELETEVEEREADLDDLRTELDEREGRLRRLEEDLEDLNAEIEHKGEDEQLAIKAEIEEIKGDIGRLEDRIEDRRETVASAEADRRDAFVEIDRKQERVEEIEAEIKETKVEASSVKAEIKEKRADLAAVREEIEAVDTEFDELKGDLQDAKERLERSRDERNERQREKDRLVDESRRAAKRIEELETRREELETKRPEVEAEIDDLEREVEKAERNRESIEDVLVDLTDERDALQAELEELEAEVRTKQNEYAELEAQAERNGDSSFGRAVSTVLNADVEGVHGAVAQLGSVDPDYATACETAAGGRMANVVVDDDGVGQRCIEYLKSRSAGRATFLPLTEMDDRGVPSVPDRSGVVDFAYNLVEFDPSYAGVFSYVLGDTLVVEDIDTARDLTGRHRLVTLDGDLVEKTGAMTGGSGGGSRYSFSGGKGRLGRVAEAIEELEDERQALREKLRGVEERVDDARDRRSEAAEALADAEADLETARERRESVRSETADVDEELDDARGRREEIDDEMAEIDDAVAELDETVAGIEAEIEELEADLADSRVPELAAEAESIEETIADLQRRLDDLEGDRNELELEKEYAEESIEELHDAVETAQNRKAAAETDIGELETRIEEREDELDEKRAEVLEIEEELTELKTDREELKGEIADARAARDEQQRAVDDVETELAELAEGAERLTREIDELEAAVGEYDPDEIPSHHEVVSRIGRIESKMEELEPVNMLAIDEYEEVEGELDELRDGRETLAEERAEIRERIDSYEAAKREAFMDAYEGINEEFERIFSRLSNGTGTLHLEDEEDPFEGGLTMRAQPRDKPIQRLEAMSGGEKSLTALAFVFAVQRYEPAPFYALDEIDAFLDAANAERVGELVDELAEEAQFVVVSHRSAMLDRSERAVGVTMGEDNVSAVTGIRLNGEVPADD